MARKLEVQIIGDASSVDRAFRAASNSAQGFGSKMAGAMSFASRAAAAGGIAVGAGIGYAIKQAAGFQDQLNTFQAVSQATGNQMKQVSELSKKLGADITLPATSAADAAAAMTELTKAGLSVTATMKAAKGVLQLSAAAEISNADAAQIVANNLNAFNLSGDKATHVADLLAASSIAASGSMTDMAESLTMAAATAAQANIPIEDVVAAIGEMANKGVIGSQSGAALQQMLLKLEKPSTAGAEAMKKLGLNVYDAHGAMLPMPALIGEFSKATEGMSQKQRDAAMNAIFGSRAIRAANIVLLGGVGAYDKMRTAVDRQGAAADVAKAKMKGFHGAMQALQSSVETLAIDLGMPMLGPLANAADKLANFVNNVDAAKTIHAKIDVVWDGLQSVADSLWKGIFGNAGSTIASHNTSGAGISKGLAASIGSAVAAIDWDAVWGQAKGIGEGLEHRFESIDWSSVGAAIGNGFSDAVDKALSGSKGLPSAFERAFRSINWNDLGRAAGPGLAAAVVSAFVAITSIGFWIKNWDLALAVGLTVFGGAVGKIAGKFAAPLVKLMDEGLMKMLPAIERFSPRLASALLAVIVRLPGLVSKGFAMLESLVSRVFGRLGKLAVFTAKVLGVQAAIDAILNLGKKIYEALKKLVTDVYNAAVAIGKAIVDGIMHGASGLAGGLGDKLKGMVHSAMDSVKSGFGIWSPSRVFAAEVGKPIADGIVAGTDGLDKSLGAALTKQVKSAAERTQISSEIASAARYIGMKQAEQVAQGFLAATPTMAQQIQQGLSAAIQKARQAVADAKSSYMQAFSTLAGQALQAFDEKVAAWIPPALKILNKMQLEDQVKQAKDAIEAAKSQLAQDEAALTVALQAAGSATQKDGESDADYATRLADLKKQAADAYNQVVGDQKALGEAERGQVELNDQLLAQKQQAAHDKQMAREREHFAKILLNLQSDLAKHPAEWDKASQRVLAILKKFDIPIYKAGTRFASQFADGMKDGLAGVAKAAHAWANAIDQYIPHSPAKTGPLSKYSAYDVGFKFATQFGNGMSDGFYRGQGMKALALSAAGGAMRAGGTGSGRPGGDVHVHVNVHGALLGSSVRDVAKTIRDEMFSMQLRGMNSPVYPL